jgi:hypothetical protein
MKLTRQLIILLSLVLVISPVTEAYSALMSDSETTQTSHCDQSKQNVVEKSCCQNDQCNSNSLTMQCSHAGNLSALSTDGRIVSSRITLSFSVTSLTQELDKGSPNIPHRPPIVTL